jgi:hypothetical protein
MRVRAWRGCDRLRRRHRGAKRAAASSGDIGGAVAVLAKNACSCEARDDRGGFLGQTLGAMADAIFQHQHAFLKFVRTVRGNLLVAVGAGVLAVLMKPDAPPAEHASGDEEHLPEHAAHRFARHPHERSAITPPTWGQGRIGSGIRRRETRRDQRFPQRALRLLAGPITGSLLG